MKKTTASCLLGSAFLSASLFTVPLQADDTGAFIGGMLTSRVLGSMQARTQAEQVQAANSSMAVQQAQQAPAPAPAPQQKTVQQRMQELDALASGGYISKEEYQAKKQAILNSI